MKITEAVWALGAMSGTSLDGVDAALLKTDGQSIEAFGDSSYRAYSDEEREILKAALGRWPGEEGVAQAAEVIEIAHAALLGDLRGVELIGLHGQTLAHDPENGRTHQAGDGAVLAEFLGLPVVWDFRTADMELGGQGAPLAPFFHHACVRYLEMTEPVGFLNLGGVGNITYIDPAIERPEIEGALVAFDTGPANAPINDIVMAHTAKPYDKNGKLAASGTADEDIVAQFLQHRYFFKIPPKSLDRNDFSDLTDMVSDLSLEDACATLVACISGAVVKGMEHMPRPLTELLVTGGGRHNRAVMTRLAADLECPVRDIDETGLDGDMLEAQAFAYLAVRVARGLPTSCASTTGVSAAVGGGTISHPQGAGV